MADTAAAQTSAPRFRGRRSTTTSYWVEGKDGKLPWSHRKIAWLVAVPLMALLIGIATTWAVFHIQNTLEDESRKDLTAAGINPEGLTFDFDYRSGTARGELPAGVSAAEAETAVDDGLLRELTIVADSGAAAPAGEDAAPAVAEPAGEASGAPAVAEAGPTQATAQLIDGQIVLAGVVLSEAHRAVLVDAAVFARGEANVRDELTVSGLAAATEGADERVQAMAEIVGTLGGAETATIALTDTSLDVTATTAGALAANVIEGVAANSPVPGVVSVDVLQGPTKVDVRLRRGGIVLRGTVLNEAQRDQLVQAAAGVVGADNVTDRLEVSGLGAAVEGADDRVTALAGLIGELGGARAATATLNDSRLRLSATTRDAASAVSITAAGDAIIATEANVSATVRPPNTATQIAGLQTELDGLAVEIRETVVFETGEAELSGEAQATLDKVVAAMESFPRPVVEVSGHTDNVGDARDNSALSADRAAAVVAYLAGGGVDEARLQSRGAGEAEPIGDNNTSNGRAENRRVEFTARASF